MCECVSEKKINHDDGNIATLSINSKYYTYVLNVSYIWIDISEKKQISKEIENIECEDTKIEEEANSEGEFTDQLN